MNNNAKLKFIRHHQSIGFLFGFLAGFVVGGMLVLIINTIMSCSCV